MSAEFYDFFNSAHFNLFKRKSSFSKKYFRLKKLIKSKKEAYVLIESVGIKLIYAPEYWIII